MGDTSSINKCHGWLYDSSYIYYKNRFENWPLSLLLFDQSCGTSPDSEESVLLQLASVPSTGSLSSRASRLSHSAMSILAATLTTKADVVSLYSDEWLQIWNCLMKYYVNNMNCRHLWRYYHSWKIYSHLYPFFWILSSFQAVIISHQHLTVWYQNCVIYIW